MIKKFDYVAAALAGFITTGIVLVTFPAHAQSAIDVAAAQQRPTAIFMEKI